VAKQHNEVLFYSNYQLRKLVDRYFPFFISTQVGTSRNLPSCF